MSPVCERSLLSFVPLIRCHIRDRFLLSDRPIVDFEVRMGREVHEVHYADADPVRYFERERGVFAWGSAALIVKIAPVALGHGQSLDPLAFGLQIYAFGASFGLGALATALIMIAEDLINPSVIDEIVKRLWPEMTVEGDHVENPKPFEPNEQMRAADPCPKGKSPALWCTTGIPWLRVDPAGNQCGRSRARLRQSPQPAYRSQERGCVCATSMKSATIGRDQGHCETLFTVTSANPNLQGSFV